MRAFCIAFAVSRSGLTSAMAHAAVEPPKYIDGFRIKQFLKYEDLIPVIEEALLNFSARESGGIVQPVRSSVAVEDRGYVCNYLFVLSISYFRCYCWLCFCLYKCIDNLPKVFC